MEKYYDVDSFSNFKELLTRTLNKYGDCDAFRFKKTMVKKGEKPEIYGMSYKEYYKEIKALGTYLCSLDSEYEKVALIAKDRYEWMSVYYATTTSNKVIVPLDKSLPDNELFSLASRSEASILFFEEKYLDSVNQIRNKNIAPNIKMYICFDFDEDKDGILSYKRIVEKGQELLNLGNTKYENIIVDSDKMSIMLFTSGTTAASKAVMLSQRNICSDIVNVLKILEFHNGDGLLALLPFHHTFQSTINHIVTYIGGYICFCDGLKYIQQNLIEYKPTCLITVPLIMEVLYKRIMKNIEKQNKTKIVNNMINFTNVIGKNNLKLKKKVFKEIHNALGGNIRIIVSGGAAMEKSLVINLKNLGFDIRQGYGLTETSPIIAVEGEKSIKSGTVGKVIPNVFVKIDNKDEKGIGEILVKGDNVMLGYYKNDEANAASFTEDRFYRTGDLGYIDPNGYLTVTGRLKNVIVQKNGKNIYPEEIESLISHVPGVKESIVYGRPTQDNDLDVCVKIVYDKDVMSEIRGYIDNNDIKEFFKTYIDKLNSNMPPYKHIRDIIVTDEELIKTTTQKVKRHEEIVRILNETK